MLNNWVLNCPTKANVFICRERKWSRQIEITYWLHLQFVCFSSELEKRRKKTHTDKYTQNWSIFESVHSDQIRIHFKSSCITFVMHSVRYRWKIGYFPRFSPSIPNYYDHFMRSPASDDAINRAEIAVCICPFERSTNWFRTISWSVCYLVVYSFICLLILKGYDAFSFVVVVVVVVVCSFSYIEFSHTKNDA